MYGLPKHIELGFLLKKELQSVSFGLHEVILCFNDYLTINVTSECTYQSKAGEIVKIDSYIASATLICTLISQSIAEARGEEDGTLTLQFTNGDMLTIYDDSNQYESYQIKHGDKLIVV
jgi:hypothetical protein